MHPYTLFANLHLWARRSYIARESILISLLIWQVAQEEQVEKSEEATPDDIIDLDSDDDEVLCPDAGEVICLDTDKEPELAEPCSKCSRAAVPWQH